MLVQRKTKVKMRRKLILVSKIFGLFEPILIRVLVMTILLPHEESMLRGLSGLSSIR